MAKKSWWQRFLDKLAAANEKEYGNDVPDCCADGRTKKQVEPNHKNKRGA
ncbi:LDCC motif putative metal-binding protein [Halocella sp. SP3-1]|nr:LDCC motif putative metal-binding protein [Halocella sp. SP3-1]